MSHAENRRYPKEAYSSIRCGPQLPRLKEQLPTWSSEPFALRKPHPLLGVLTSSAIHSLGIVRLIDVQEAKELSKPEWVGIRELVSPGYHLVQAPRLLDLKW